MLLPLPQTQTFRYVPGSFLSTRGIFPCESLGRQGVTQCLTQRPFNEWDLSSAALLGINILEETAAFQRLFHGLSRGIFLPVTPTS